MSSISQSFPQTIRLGYVPLVDAAPLIIAKELGFFQEAGLNVELVREPGWASVRDKLVMGSELEGAHALAGLAFALNYGIGCLPSPCLTGLVLNENGNGLTISKELYQRGVTSQNVVQPGLRGLGGRILRIAIVHSASSHHYLVHHLMTKAGLQMDSDVELVTLPPELMPQALASGNIDAFSAGEPWNSVATQGFEGFCLTTSRELHLNHPEKILLVRKSFAEERPEEHALLIRATLRGCQFCAETQNSSQVARVLSSPSYLGIPVAILQNSLLSSYQRGQGVKANIYCPLHTFFGDQVNRPSTDGGNVILNQLNICGVIPQSRATDTSPITRVSDIFRGDLFDDATNPTTDPCQAIA